MTALLSPTPTLPPAEAPRERPWLDTLRSELRLFLEAVRDRARREHDIAATFARLHQQAETEFQTRRTALEGEARQAREQHETQKQAAIQALQDTHEQLHLRTKTEYEKAREEVLGKYHAGKSELEEQVNDQRWHVNARFEAERRSAQDQLARHHHEADTAITRLEETRAKAAEVLRSWQLDPDFVPPAVSPDVLEGDPWAKLARCLELGKETLEKLLKMPQPLVVKGNRPYVFIAAFWLVSLGIGFYYLEWYWSLVQATVTILPLGFLFRMWLIGRMEREAEKNWDGILQADIDARAARGRGLKKADEVLQSERAAMTAERDKALARLAEKAKKSLEKLRQRRDGDLQKHEEVFPPRLKREKAEFKEKLQRSAEDFQKSLIELKARQDRTLLQVSEHFKQTREDLNRKHAQAWAELVREWKASCDRCRTQMRGLTRHFQQAFPPWEQANLATAMPMGLRFGSLDLTLGALPNVTPSDPSLVKLDGAGLEFPALLSFPEKSSLLLETQEEGREQGLQALEAILLRAWLALPPGRARCTIIDPVGRGEHFAAFMHLADQDPALVNSRIWTEVGQIEQRMGDLTSHMETILQKFLRNQYETLAQYNEQAGEIAEPFRFLVVANFPVNFSPDAAQRLLSLASSGARCGIYTFILADTRQPLPQGMHWEDFEKACCTLLWQNDHFAWQDEDFSPYPLTLESMPSDVLTTALMKRIGDAAVAAGKVELPFHAISPAQSEWWKERTDAGIFVPIGKAGARRLQPLSLGQGTSQHVLIAGKTGSGKSTLLHVIIMQLALRYSPDEMELYLIDFKKGVEFKTYAHNQLPHARVVAVESEREFGLSVLQRLDLELTRRGDLFRKFAVNDLPSYRRLAQDRPTLPRVLLVVDEFQEFFVEDDKIAQECALLLDRLVRQGRAFGVHLLLGSQTLGGAFSLARTTIDQMAVRVALQCSEADAGLILSRENTEARLLSRPGEAIYNAVNGLLEGNQFFQIVWLEDGRRDKLLEALRGLAKTTPLAPREPAIVFEGNAAADPSRNPQLDPHQPFASEAGLYRAWLGESVAIKEPAHAVFRPQSGSNLLLLGQQHEHAFHVMSAAAWSLARHPGAQLAFVIGQALEPEQETQFEALAQKLPIERWTQRDLGEKLQAWTAELDQRLAGAKSTGPRFLCLYGFQRMRDLRKPDDDFGFGKKGEDQAPHRLFAKLLREGPTVGIFTILWCDNFTNLQRQLDRQGMREFEMRVLFQMNANDSSNVMDSPVAAKLGAHRAYLYSEDQGRMEKFRPYGKLPEAWM